MPSFTVATTTITPSVLFSTSEWNFWNRKQALDSENAISCLLRQLCKNGRTLKVSQGWLYNEKQED